MEKSNNDVVEQSKVLELGILMFIVHQIESTIGKDSASARAIAINEIRKYTNKSTKAFISSTSDAIEDTLSTNNAKALDGVMRKGAKPIPVGKVNKKYIKECEDYFKKYIKTENIRLSGQSVTQYYYNFISENVKDIVDGKITTDQATRKAVKQLAECGVKVIDYRSGISRNVDVVVRQQMEYASKQSAQDTREAFAKANGITIWEFDAHPNARPSHQAWQGKRYDTTGKDYPTLEELTYGEDKDFGCKHRAYPVFDKRDKYMFTKEELDNIDTKPFEWRGKEYDGYQATQQARKMERDIRALKREKSMLGDNVDNELNSKLRIKNAEYKDFMNTFGTYPRTNRTSDYIKPKTHITGVDKKESIPNRKSSNTSSKKETSKKEVTKNKSKTTDVNKMGRDELVSNARDIFVKKNSNLSIDEANKRFDLLIDGNSNTYLKKYINKNRL